MREGAIWWAVSGSVLSAAVFIVARLYQINEKTQVLLICNSRKVAKTELYNVQQEKEEMVRRRESERKRDLGK